MAVGPQIEVYREVEIRYGYDIGEDEYVAHFDLPPERRKDAGKGSQVIVRDMPRTFGGKQTVRSRTVEHLLKIARSQIDEFLG